MSEPTITLPEPGWDEAGTEFVIKTTEHWVVSVAPMIFNDRICIATPEEHGRFYTAGWCYPREDSVSGLQTMVRALAWDPETEREPEGYLKCAYDRRKGSLL